MIAHGWLDYMAEDRIIELFGRAGLVWGEREEGCNEGNVRLLG